jgi:predicted acyl esterase
MPCARLPDHGATEMTRNRITMLALALSVAGTVDLASLAEPATTHVVMVPLRDGVRLKTSVFFAGGVEESRPILLLRTPYNQESYAVQAQRLVEAGYTAVTQDCRGRYGSEGEDCSQSSSRKIDLKKRGTLWKK